MATFHDIYETVRRSEKKTLIRTSGSTREGGGEKVRAGQSYLYKLRGMESEVIELRLREKVSGSFLNQALLSALPRYPYFNTRLIELDGDFYIVQNPQSMVARRTRELARLGHVSCGGHLVDITHYDRSIFFSFHHALCDGRGVKPFIETLMYYYFRLKHGVTAVPPSAEPQRDRDYCRRQANGFIGLFDRLDERGSYEAKREMMGFFEGMGLNTYVVSFLARFNFGGGAHTLHHSVRQHNGSRVKNPRLACASRGFGLQPKEV